MSTLPGNFLVLLTWALSLTICFQTAALAFDENRILFTYRVHIIDNLPTSNPKLSVHCKSKDDDLGDKILTPNQEFSWKFKINIWGTTLFYCDAQWGTRRKHFDAFVVTRDERRCQRPLLCLWSIRENGFYFSNNNVTWSSEYLWNSTDDKSN